jgi:hypothetical protein
MIKTTRKIEQKGSFVTHYSTPYTPKVLPENLGSKGLCPDL